MTGRDGGSTVRLADLAARGVRLLGRLEGCEAGGELLRFEGERAVEMAAAEADSFLLEFCANVDAHRASLPAADRPPPPDAADQALIAAAQAAVAAATIRDTDAASETRRLRAADLGAVIWATGYSYDFSLLQGFDSAALLDDAGYPLTKGDTGRSPADPGLHYVGLNWGPFRKSGILLGVAADAAEVAASVMRHIDQGSARARI